MVIALVLTGVFAVLVCILVVGLTAGPSKVESDCNRSTPKRVLFTGSKTARINYEDADGVKTESRDIIIREIYARGQSLNRQYIDAFCTLRNEKRCFRLDRVISILDLETGELFDSPKQFVRTIELDQRNHI